MLIQIIASIIVWQLVLFAAWYITEKKQLPEYLQFKPFNCRKCCTFWSNIIIFLAIGLTFNLWWFMGLGIVLGILTTIALYVDQKQKTVKVDDVYGEDIEIITEGDEIKVRKV